jgi:hypothetical protein
MCCDQILMTIESMVDHWEAWICKKVCYQISERREFVGLVSTIKSLQNTNQIFMSKDSCQSLWGLS